MRAQPPDEENYEDLGERDENSRHQTYPHTGNSGSVETLIWGEVGENRFGRLSTGGMGIIRRVKQAGIEYANPAPPLELVWNSHPQDRFCFEMTWEIDQQQAKSFHQIATDVWSVSNTLRQDDPRLKLLDQASEKILRMVGELHRNGWAIGLLQPRNIIFDGESSGLPTPVDLGFTFKGKAQPNWLYDNPFARLWDKSPVEQQYVQFENEMVPISADLRVVARMFAWVLTRDFLPLEEWPTHRGTWQVLRRAANGEFDSAEPFLAELRSAPLSLELAQPAPDNLSTVGPSSRLPLLLAGTLILVPLIAAGVFLLVANHDKNQSVDQVTPTTPEITEHKDVDQKNLDGSDSPPDVSDRPPEPPPEDLESVVTRFLAADDDQKAALVNEFYTTTSSHTGDADENTTRWRAYLRTEYLKSCIRRYEELTVEADDPSNRYEIASRLNALHAEMSELIDRLPPSGPATTVKEQRCLDVIKERADELRLPY